MKWKKPSAQLIETFDRLLPQAKGVERRKMFGYPTGFVNGNWFMGCYGEDDIVLRLSQEDRQQFLALDGARPFEPMPGRIMREFVVVPPWPPEDTEQMQQWVKRSLEHASGLTPKAKKKKGA